MATTDRATMICKVITPETYKVTKIVEDITPEGLDILEESIGETLTKHKAYHFTRGTDFGHLVGSRNDKNSISRKRTYAETVANYVTPHVAPQIAMATHVES